MINKNSRGVLHCITTISLGGAEKQLLTLASEQVKLGLDAQVIFLKGSPDLKENFELDGVKVLSFLANKNFLFQVIMLKKYLLGRRTILHGHLPRAELISAICKGRNSLVITKHNSEKFFPKSNLFVSKLLARLVLLRANKCISISDAVQNYLIRIKEIKPSNKLFVVRYGYSPTYKENLLKLKQKAGYGCDKSIFRIGTISRLVEQKDIYTLLKSFEQFRSTIANSHLVIIGDGYLRKDLQNFAKVSKISEHVTWIYKTTNIYENLKLLDLFVLTSRYEGFGLVLLEALQVGVPILASKTSAIPEVLGHDYPGFFTSGDYLDLTHKMHLAYDPQYRKSLKHAGIKRLKLFDPKSMAEQIQRVYCSIG